MLCIFLKLDFIKHLSNISKRTHTLFQFDTKWKPVPIFPRASKLKHHLFYSSVSGLVSWLNSC